MKFLQPVASCLVKLEEFKDFNSSRQVGVFMIISNFLALRGERWSLKKVNEEIENLLKIHYSYNKPVVNLNAEHCSNCCFYEHLKVLYIIIYTN